MSAIVLSLIVIVLAQTYPLIVKFLRINRTLWLFTLLFSIVVVMFAAVAGFFNLPVYSTGEIILLSVALIGFMIRVNVFYFRKEASVNSSRD